MSRDYVRTYVHIDCSLVVSLVLFSTVVVACEITTCNLVIEISEIADPRISSFKKGAPFEALLAASFIEGSQPASQRANQDPVLSKG